MVDGGEVARLAHLFARAAIEPAGWPDALKALAASTRSGFGELVIVGGPKSVGPGQSWTSEAGMVDHARFIAAGGYSPAANPRIAASLRSRPAEVLHEYHYDAVAPLLIDDGVRDLFHEVGIEAGCQAALIQTSELLVGLAVLRGGRDGRTAEADRALFEAVVPFARDAAHVHLALEQQSGLLLAGTFEALGSAAFLLDGAGKVRGRTAAAETLLAGGRLRLDDGRLTARHPRDAAILANAIGASIVPAGELPPPLRTVALAGTAGTAPLLVDISALPRVEWSFGVAARTLVIVRGGVLRREAAAALLRQAWDLSEAEAEVVLRLSDGQSRSEIAAARVVSVETVRAQLKSVFVKLGVAREAEVVARAAPLIAGVR